MSDRRSFMKMLGLGATGVAAVSVLPTAAAEQPRMALQESCPSCNFQMRHSRISSRNESSDVMHFCDHCGFVFVAPIMNNEQIAKLKRGFVKPLNKGKAFSRLKEL